MKKTIEPKIITIPKEKTKIQKTIEGSQSYYKKHRAKYPWMISFWGANARCNNSKNQAYDRYGGRGIKFLLSASDIKHLWDRDKASLMNKPSLDRKDNYGHYTQENCQFIELAVNSCKDISMAVVAYKDDVFVDTYSSQAEASRKLNICQSVISTIVNGISEKTRSGYAFKRMSDCA